MDRQQRALLCSALLALLAPFAAAVLSKGAQVQGFATFYGGPQDGLSPTQASGGLSNGACGYEALSQQDWPFWEVVSIGPNNPVAYKGNKKGCGYCISATCTGTSCGANAKPVTLLVTDACETCSSNQLNLNALTFQNSFNSDLSVGRVNITFEQVDCTPPGDILAKVVKFRVGLGNYIGFALMAVAGEGTIGSVEVRGQGAEYTPMVNYYGDVWEASSFGNAPLDIRVTDNYGRTLEALGAITQIAAGTYDLGVQYPLTSAAPSPAPVPAPLSQPPASIEAPGFSPSFVTTQAGQFCDASCFSQGLTASQFKKIGTTLNTFACAVDLQGVGAVAGYQLSNGTATCSVAVGTSVVESPNYACLCQTQAQTQGLQPFNGTACNTSCDISIDGLTGMAVPADDAMPADNYVCLPLSETSLENRFGYTTGSGAGEQCVIDLNGKESSTSTFSCFCLFTAPATATSRR